MSGIDWDSHVPEILRRIDVCVPMQVTVPPQHAWFRGGIGVGLGWDWGGISMRFGRVALYDFPDTFCQSR